MSLIAGRSLHIFARCSWPKTPDQRTSRKPSAPPWRNRNDRRTAITIDALPVARTSIGNRGFVRVCGRRILQHAPILHFVSLRLSLLAWLGPRLSRGSDDPSSHRWTLGLCSSPLSRIRLPHAPLDGVALCASVLWPRTTLSVGQFRQNRWRSCPSS